MTATPVPVADLLAPPVAKPPASPPPAPPGDPIAAARQGVFDRAAIRNHLAKLEADHAARRPALTRRAEAARREADRAKAAADQAAAEARDAEAAAINAELAIQHTRNLAAGIFAANEPARLTEARDALRSHFGDLMDGRLPRDESDIPARGRRLGAVTGALREIDRLARVGTDGPDLEDAITGLIAGIDRAEATEPPATPDMNPQVVALYAALRDRQAKAAASGSPTAAARVEALVAAQKDLAALRPGDPNVVAKAAAIGERVRVAMPPLPEPYREPKSQYRPVRSADEE